MSDNLKIKQPQDPNFVNVHEAWELAYWTKKFGVTETALKEAVKKVGTSVAALTKHFGK